MSQTHSPGPLPKSIKIRDISTFCTRWSIIGRVVKSEPIREFQNSRGPSKVWSINIVDKEGDEIVGTFWSDGIEKFHKSIQEGQWYSFSKGTVKVSNKRFTTCPHAYGLTFSSDSRIEPIQDDSVKDIQCVRKYNTEGGLRSLKTCNKERIDVLGIVLTSKAALITTKAGESKPKRDIILCDSSGHKIQVDVWGTKPGDLDGLTDAQLSNHAIIGIRNCRVRDYRGKTLNAAITDIDVVPQDKVTDDLPQHKAQLDWFQENRERLATLVPLTEEYAGGSSLTNDRNNVINVDRPLSLQEAHDQMHDLFVKQSNLKGEMYFKTIVYPNRFFYSARDEQKLTCMYKACAGCGKKWSENLKCSGTCNDPVSEFRYALQTSLADFSGSRLMARFFGKQAESIVGVAADDIQSDFQAAASAFDWKAPNRPVAVRLRANTNEYNGESRLNISAMTAEPLEGSAFIDESLLLIQRLESHFPNLAMTGIKRTRTVASIDDDEMNGQDMKRVQTTPMSA